MKKIFFLFKTPLLTAVFFVFIITTAQAVPAMTKSNLNLRNGAGKQHNIEFIIPAYTLIEVKKCVHDWCLIEFNNKAGWVSKSFLAFPNNDDSSLINTTKPNLGHYWQDDWYWKHKD